MNLPNAISLARFVASPVVIWLISANLYLAAFWLFLAAGLSDAVDGFIAKRCGAVTELGAYLDPIADKVLLGGAYVTLSLNGALPPWLAILVVFRDVSIGGGWVLLIGLVGARQVSPLWVSKLNTVVQILLATTALADLAYGPVPAGLMSALIYLTAVTTATSGIAYGRRLLAAGADLETLP